MSEETYTYLCNKLRPAMERQDTAFRVCIPLKKRVAIALWKLATGSEYRSIGHLFGENHCDYFNCKGWHSIFLQGVVDGKGLFWNVFAGMPGSLHDAQVLRLSTLWELASRGNYLPACTRNIGGVNAGYYILGDSAYPLQNWLLKPFPDTGRLTAEQQIYNRNICRARVVVEKLLVD
ncbi:hypothetical protein JOQ06_004237 [Pogonophryne albipinna]|uniref:DDE Tnp4 domain-containing protein n=1 Tax=Pogonophryne albipinna TaxID=1090488 RepID=A0AAD6APR3_9TELE|nr:hypothetical protein JOQ06_004237 [Pogonophryne albipinna]